MGFWSPQSLVADAKRHGVTVRRPDVDVGRAVASLEAESGPARRGRDAGRGPDGVVPPDRAAVRLGLSSVRGIGSDAAARIEAGAPWSGMEDLVRRAGVTRAQLEALATAGALDDVGGPGRTGRAGRAGGRRSLVWGAWEEVSDDLWSLGMAPDTTAMELARAGLDRRGVVRAAVLAGRPAGDRVTVGGVVTHRQAPESAHGAVFLNLEDETGMVNIVCSRGAWIRWKPVARACPALLVRGRVERSEGSMTLVAERFEPLPLGPVPSSRDFR